VELAGISRTSTCIPAGRNPSRPFRNQVVFEGRSVGLAGSRCPTILLLPCGLLSKNRATRRGPKIFKRLRAEAKNLRVTSGAPSTNSGRAERARARLSGARAIR
jgi:hypothetical protein